MLRYYVPEHKGERLFEVILEPSVPTVDKLMKSTDMGAGEIKTILGKCNKVAVGKPIFKRITSEDIDKEKGVIDEIKRMLPDYDFHQLSLSCTIEPDPDCIFTWVTFGVELMAISESSESGEKAIAWSIFPDELLTEIKYERVVELSPELTIGLATVKVGGKLGSRTTKQSFIAYEPQIYSSGFRRPTMAWTFKATKAKGIWGDKKDLLSIVRVPKDNKLKGKFKLGAEVKLKNRLIPLSKRRDDRIVDEEYDLSV